MKKYNPVKKVLGCILIMLIYLVVQTVLIIYLKITSYHKLTISIILLAGVICTEIIYTYIDDTRLFNNNEDLYNKIQFYWNKKQAWMSCHFLWLTAYYFLSGMSVLSSCIIIYVTSQDSNALDAVILYSIIALSLTFLNLIIKPYEGSKAYREAYNRMEKDILNYVNGTMKIEDFPSEFEYCENLITNGLY